MDFLNIVLLELELPKFIYIIIHNNRNRTEILSLTARQYGEVVLPDAASGQGPGTRQLAGHKAVTVQGGYGALFAVMVQILLSITRVAVQV